MSGRDQRASKRDNEKNSFEVEELRRALKESEERVRKKSDERRAAVDAQRQSEERVRKKSDERRAAVEAQRQSEERAKAALKQAERNKDIGLRTYNAKKDCMYFIFYLFFHFSLADEIILQSDGSELTEEIIKNIMKAFMGLKRSRKD